MPTSRPPVTPASATSTSPSSCPRWTSSWREPTLKVATGTQLDSAASWLSKRVASLCPIAEEQRIRALRLGSQSTRGTRKGERGPVEPAVTSPEHSHPVVNLLEGKQYRQYARTGPAWQASAAVVD